MKLVFVSLNVYTLSNPKNLVNLEILNAVVLFIVKALFGSDVATSW